MISTRTPHAGSDAKKLNYLRCTSISTRTPHAGSDTEANAYNYMVNIFQPALPMRGVTWHSLVVGLVRIISTRTPHAGSDHSSP